MCWRRRKCPLRVFHKGMHSRRTREDVAPRECDDIAGCFEGFNREMPPDSIDAGETFACSCGSSIISSGGPERKVDCVLDASVHRCVEELTLLTEMNYLKKHRVTRNSILHCLNTIQTATAAVCSSQRARRSLSPTRGLQFVPLTAHVRAQHVVLLL